MTDEEREAATVVTSEAERTAGGLTDEANRVAGDLADEASRTAGGLTDEALRVAMTLKYYRRFTIVYSMIGAGVVALLMAYFISNELSKGVEANQDRIESTQADLVMAQKRAIQEQVDACVRSAINRTEKFNTAIFEEENAIYMASQEDDPEIRAGWDNREEFAIQRQNDIRAEAERIGFRLPGSVVNDCDKVVATP